MKNKINKAAPKIVEDVSIVNREIKKMILRLKNKYPLEGVEFCITGITPNYVGMNIEMDSPAYNAYFKGSDM